MSINQQIADAFARIRAQRPLIHHITNLVVMNDTANLTLHLGALPVMAHAVEEVAEMTAAAGALLLNLGTLTPERAEAMLVAGRAANDRKIPVVLDPVGAGATRLRTETALRLLHELEVAVVRGNAGEIASLSRSRDFQIAHDANSEPAPIASDLVRSRDFQIAHDANSEPAPIASDLVRSRDLEIAHDANSEPAPIASDLVRSRDFQIAHDANSEPAPIASDLVRSRDLEIAHDADTEPTFITSDHSPALVKGVESVGDAGDPLALVRSAARRWSSGRCRSVVVITGPRDVLSDGRRALGVDNGHRWLTTITGTGCMATTAIAAFCAVEPDPLLAAAGGLACLGLAAERAAQRAHGPASFRVALLDAVYGLTPEELYRGARIVELEVWKAGRLED